jgi:hypothetical protein
MPRIKTQNAPTEPTEPIYITTAECAAMLGTSKEQLKTWRLGERAKNPARGRKKAPLLTEGVHWIAYSSRKVLFHRELMRDFVANYNRPQHHQKAVEKFLADLPSSRAVSGAGD